MTWLDDLQRRLAIVGARSLGRQVAGQVGRTFRGAPADVWGTATTEPAEADSAGNAPECAWCPVCRAIRMARDSNPDLAGRVGEAADALMSAAQDVVASVDAAFSGKPEPQRATSPPSLAQPAAATEPSVPQERAAARNLAAAPQPAGPNDREEPAAGAGPEASAGEQPPPAPPSPNGQLA